jgi:catechol 2,3-dioxygenase-like lactoylglutathione lyase family enzyme
VASVRYMVDDLRAATAFYVEQLGFTEKENWGPIVILERVISSSG